MMKIWKKGVKSKRDQSNLGPGIQKDVAEVVGQSNRVDIRHRLELPPCWVWVLKG
jgi:hypothetical protein